jgi:DNA segregation ATPase FtsK/SpoIIIE, S-DNA-T family
MEKIDSFNKTLQAFKIKATCVEYKVVDNYFYYDVKLSPSTKVKDLTKYLDEISLSLKTPCKPSVKILHKEGVIRLEFAQPRTSTLNLFDFFTNSNLPKGELLCLLGQTVDGRKMWMDLAQNPHMIVSGTTGSGKSCLLHNIIANIFNYGSAQLFLMDPKNIEFSEYDKRIKNKVSVSYSYEESLFMLDNLLEIMESRYSLLRRGKQATDFPYIVLIIDEFADLIMQDTGDQFYEKLCRLAQKCRAARIHIILATQRPSVNIINGTIKANFPARIACRVASQVDSKVILDTGGAENLLGQGDALIRDNFRQLERFQVAYTTPTEICNYYS